MKLSRLRLLNINCSRHGLSAGFICLALKLLLKHLNVEVEEWDAESICLAKEVEAGNRCSSTQYTQRDLRIGFVNPMSSLLHNLELVLYDFSVSIAY